MNHERPSKLLIHQMQLKVQARRCWHCRKSVSPCGLRMIWIESVIWSLRSSAWMRRLISGSTLWVDRGRDKDCRRYKVTVTRTKEIKRTKEVITLKVSMNKFSPKHMPGRELVYCVTSIGFARTCSLRYTAR